VVRSIASRAGDLSHARRLLAINRHQERELTAGQTYRPQRFVKLARHRARRPLNVQAHAGVANKMRNRDRQPIAI
jgi:hypothetical protein